MICIENLNARGLLISAIIILICSTTRGALFDNVTFVNDTTCLFFVSRIHLINTETKNKIIIPPQPNTHKVVCEKDKSTLNLKYGAVDEIQSLDLSFEFTKNPRNWQASSTNISVKCNSGSKTCVNVDAGQMHLKWLTSPSQMSYKCGDTPVTKIISSKADSIPLGVEFYWLQFQPFDASGGRFNEAVDCVGLFTIPIWSVLLVSFLLIGILSYGLIMLGAVQPNALYDDPKTKMVQLGGNN